jgi:hypothetical protein
MHPYFHLSYGTVVQKGYEYTTKRVSTGLTPILFFGFGLYKRNDGACAGKNIIHKYIISYLRLYQYALRLYHPEALQCSLWQSLMMYIVAEEWYNLNAYLSSPPVFSGVRVTRSLVLYVCFIDRCLSC